MVTIRVGVPLTGGALVQHVHREGLPVLFSANAFFTHRPDGTTRLRPHKLPEGLNAALDSAGFVAMARYGAYPWTVEDYLDLVESYPWAWYSGMDMCCEEEIAGDRRTVRMRLAGTIHGYLSVLSAARRRGLPDPIPILQGRSLEDYLWCADQLGVSDGLVGLGSFCRREVGGPEGIVHLVESLSRALPRARWHLFGVKGKSLEAIGAHPNVESIDSMAWDLQARYERPTGRTMEFRIEKMTEWLQANRDRKTAAAPPPKQAHLRIVDEPEPVQPAGADDTISEWMDLVASGEIDYASAMAHMDHTWADACGWFWLTDGEGRIGPFTETGKLVYGGSSAQDLLRDDPSLRRVPFMDSDDGFEPCDEDGWPLAA